VKVVSPAFASDMHLFGASNVSYQIARDGLPATFTKARWNRHIEGLFGPVRAPMVYIVRKAPAAAWITLLATLAAAFAFKVVYRARSYRRLAQGAAAPLVTAATATTTT
jgi:hypothetical protein